MIVEGYDLPLVRHPRAALPVYAHQANMIDGWTDHDSFLLSSKTGSGKTAAWTLAYLAHRDRPGEQNVVCVYPTNELIRDQERSIYDVVVNKEGLTCHMRAPGGSGDVVADVEIVRVDGAALEAHRRRLRVRTKGQALYNLLHADRPKIVLMNPDTLYLLFAMRYSQSGEALGALQAYRTIVFDEFHLYTGVELAHALFMGHLARELNMFRRVVLLSATPHPDVRRHIDRLLAPYTIDPSTPAPYAVVGSRRVNHQVELLPEGKLAVTSGGVVPYVRDRLLALKPELEARRASTPLEAAYVPAVAILNSVVNAIDLEDALLGSGFAPGQIVPMRGLVASDARQLRPDQVVVVGTSAVEVGIDFRTDFLLFEAGDAAAFRQRFGRLGRHAPGKAFFFGDDRECDALDHLGPILSRQDFDSRVMALFPEADARSWFVDSKLGAFSVMVQAFAILRRVADDKHGDFSEKDTIRKWLYKALDEYAARLDMSSAMKFAQGLYKHSRAGRMPWVADYERIDSFRTSLPTVRVTDRAERRRGRATDTYEADVKTLLARARIVDDTGHTIVIDGYERYRPVFTNKNFRDESEKEGTMLSTRDYAHSLMLKRITPDGKLDPILSWSMSSEEEPHVFVFVSKDLVADQIDWRVATFPAGQRSARYLVAFDGDALLLKEIYRRAKAERQIV